MRCLWLAWLAVTVALGLPAVADDTAPEAIPDDPAGLAARLTIRDIWTGAPTEPEAGRGARLSVELTDVITGSAPRGLMLGGFARPVEPGMPTCEQAARAFLTTGRAPGGSVPFGAPALVVTTEDGALGVVDPQLNLQSANMLAAARLAEPPAFVLPDPARARILATLPGRGELVAVAIAGGAPEVLVSGLDAPAEIALHKGAIFVASAGQVVELDLRGARRAVHPVASDRARLLAVPKAAPLAYSAEGGIWAEGTLHETGRRLVDATVAGPRTLLSLEGAGDQAAITYLDAIDQPLTIGLGRPFHRIAADPAGRFGLAWSPGEAPFVLIDLATAEVAQAAALATGTVSDVLLTDERAFLLSLDGGLVGVVELPSVRRGAALQMVSMVLGVTEPEPRTGPGLLVDAGDGRQVLAVAPSIGRAFLIDPAMALNGQPPMDGTQLRGGVPVGLKLYDRRLVETASGRFEATWAFATGPWQLVLVSGPGGFTECLPFTIPGLSDRLATIPLRLEGEPARIGAAASSRIRLRFRDPSGALVALPATDILVPALGSSWRMTVKAYPDPDGALSLAVTPPHPGPLALQPVSLPPGFTLRSGFILEVEE